MDKLYYYVQQTDRLLEPGMDNVIRVFQDSKMPHMELSNLKLTKADKEWLSREYAVSYVLSHDMVSHVLYCLYFRV